MAPPSGWKDFSAWIDCKDLTWLSSLTVWSFTDSWSSGSSREVCIPPENPTTWAKKDTDDEAVSASPDGREVVSSSLNIGDDEPGLKVVRPAQGAVTIPQSPQGKTSQSRKAKVRTAFSEGQMNALTHRFSMQRYLTPAEMKTLAGLTGLTYKQVSDHALVKRPYCRHRTLYWLKLTHL